jgi:hypothetical protein
LPAIASGRIFIGPIAGGFAGAVLAIRKVLG